MLTIAPLPRLRISGHADLHAAPDAGQVGRHHLVPAVASSISSTTPPIARAALLTRMSMPPKRSTAAAGHRLHVGHRRRRRCATKSAVPPAASMLAARSPAPAAVVDVGDRPPSRRRSASSLRRRPCRCPSPRPVTIATRPSNSLRHVHSPLKSGSRLSRKASMPSWPSSRAVEPEQHLLLEACAAGSAASAPCRISRFISACAQRRDLQHGARPARAPPPSARRRHERRREAER